MEIHNFPRLRNLIIKFNNQEKMKRRNKFYIQIDGIQIYLLIYITNLILYSATFGDIMNS